MLRKCYLGFSADTESGYIPMDFYNPTSQNEYHSKKVAVDWITSFSEAQDGRNERLKGHKTYVDYELYKDDYLTMPYMLMKDDSLAIRVPADQIPDNYTGWMFTAANALTKISFDDFEWYGTEFGGYFNKINPQLSPFKNKVTHEIYKIGEKTVFAGIVLRRKVK